MGLEVKTNNTKVIVDAIGDAIEAAMEEIGLTAEGLAKRYEKRVDTGRLRNSITHKTIHSSGYDYTDNEGRAFDGTLSEGIKRNEVIIGSNVEYAPIIEHETPFLVPAVSSGERYRAIIKKHLESGE